MLVFCSIRLLLEPSDEGLLSNRMVLRSLFIFLFLSLVVAQGIEPCSLPCHGSVLASGPCDQNRGGARGTRTLNLLPAEETLPQLSYSPVDCLAKFIVLAKNLVGAVGLEPTKPFGVRSTAACNCRYAILPCFSVPCLVVRLGFEPSHPCGNGVTAHCASPTAPPHQVSLFCG